MLRWCLEIGAGRRAGCGYHADDLCLESGNVVLGRASFHLAHVVYWGCTQPCKDTCFCSVRALVKASSIARTWIGNLICFSDRCSSLRPVFDMERGLGQNVPVLAQCGVETEVHLTETRRQHCPMVSTCPPGPIHRPPVLSRIDLVSHQLAPTFLSAQLFIKDNVELARFQGRGAA